MSLTERKLELMPEHFASIFGQFDCYMKKIEREFHVTVFVRGDSARLLGTEADVSRAAEVFRQLSEILRHGGAIGEQEVDYAISLARDGRTEDAVQMSEDCICHTVLGKPVAPKTLGQKRYADAIRQKMIVFGQGPAGTGKTYLAIAMAVTAFKNEKVGRIILTRPAIEAGEKLGFLPGDLQKKIDPYLRPLYDALYQIMGAESFARNTEKGLIEVAPLAYMRGRTLDNAFIILDEAQNTTPAQMKMFLTRIGFGSKAVITGDVTQKDLAGGARSGLDAALRILKNVEGIGICELTGNDVVRHPLVQKIVRAYEDYEGRQDGKKNRPSGRKRHEGRLNGENGASSRPKKYGKRTEWNNNGQKGRKKYENRRNWKNDASSGDKKERKK